MFRQMADMAENDQIFLKEMSLSIERDVYRLYRTDGVAVAFAAGGSMAELTLTLRAAASLARQFATPKLDRPQRLLGNAADEPT